MSFLDRWLPWRLRTEMERQRLSWSTGLKNSEDDRRHQVGLAKESVTELSEWRDAARAQMKELRQERDEALQGIAKVVSTSDQIRMGHADAIAARDKARTELAKLQKAASALLSGLKDHKQAEHELLALVPAWASDHAKRQDSTLPLVGPKARHAVKKMDVESIASDAGGDA